MQNPPLVLHKWGENIRNLPLRIRTNCIVCAMELACRGIKLRGWPGVRWPFVWSSMAIGVAPKWPSVSGPMAIHLESDGHRTGVETPFSASHSGQTFVRGAFWRVDFPLFKSFASRFRVVFNDLRGADASKIAYFHALPLSHGNTRFSRTEYAV